MAFTPSTSNFNLVYNKVAVFFPSQIIKLLSFLDFPLFSQKYVLISVMVLWGQHSLCILGRAVLVLQSLPFDTGYVPNRFGDGH